MNKKYSLFFSKHWLPQDEQMISVLENTSIESENRFYIVDEIESADFAILPFFLNREKYHIYIYGLRKISALLTQHQKKLIIFYMNDDNDDIDIENTIIFRPGLYKSQNRKDEYPCPFFIDDICSLETENKLKIVKRENMHMPIIGFCGDTNSVYAGQEVRNKILAKLIESRWCRTNFILRMNFYYHQNKDRKKLVRKEYIENLQESEFCLSVRGAGNFSIRFYEICCLGKIPVFINTDCWLPFDDLISYRNLFLWIEAGEFDYAGEKVNCLNRSLSDEEYQKRSLAIRNIWVNYFSLNGFFNHMGKYLQLSKTI